jgi:hypothetical protein
LDLLLLNGDGVFLSVLRRMAVIGDGAERLRHELVDWLLSNPPGP